LSRRWAFSTDSLVDYELSWVRGREAVEKAIALREEWRGSFTPVIIGTRGDFNHLTDIWKEEEFPTPQEYLESARRFDFEKWSSDHGFENEVDPEFVESLRKPSAWNAFGGGEADFCVVREILSRKFHPWVLLAKIPTAQPYEVPAYLRLGGWNECPDAAAHVAHWQRWQNKYGAEILCVSGDVIEATVAHPPTEKEECYMLAQEQFYYCQDIVTQGVETIDALAATLRGGKSWYFWWD
jgi:hypothetical protein